MTEMFARVDRVSPDDLAATYDAYQSALHGYALAITRDAAVAEDLVQETFVRLIADRRAGRVQHDVKAWLFTVCTNLVRSRSRRRIVADRWTQILGREDRAAIAEPPDATALRRESHEELTLAMATLPREMQMALTLAAHGFASQEIARILHRSDGATRNLLWRGRAALRDRLSGEGAS